MRSVRSWESMSAVMACLSYWAGAGSAALVVGDQIVDRGRRDVGHHVEDTPSHSVMMMSGMKIRPFQCG